MKRRKLEGQRFGRWIVLAHIAGVPTKYSCRCDCGTVRSVYGAHLMRELSMSCGCLAAEINRTRDRSEDRRRAPKHGHATGALTPTYATWSSVVARCTNPKATQYRWYGGRGIRVCERWLKFENFLADMGERPAGMSIDRIDNDGDYEPGNCRWATKETQAGNMSSTKLGPLTKIDAVFRVLCNGETRMAVSAALGVSIYPVYDAVQRVKRDREQVARWLFAAEQLGQVTSDEQHAWSARALDIARAAWSNQ